MDEAGADGVPPVELEKVNQAFTKADVTGDGFIDADEVQNLLASLQDIEVALLQAEEQSAEEEEDEEDDEAEEDEEAE